MKVLYFTSTGNCLYAAKKIGGDLISIPKAVNNNEYVFEDEKIGIVFPVFGLCVPPYIKNFLSKAQFKCKYLFAIVTYGFYDGATITNLLDIAKENSIEFNYVNKLKMVENYLPAFDMEKEKTKVSDSDIDKNLNKIVLDIGMSKDLILKDSIFDKFMTWTHKKKYAYDIGKGMTDKYKVLDKCEGCGICTKLCPTSNISVKDGKVVFGENCLSCLKCIQNCPGNSIVLVDEKGKTRFRNNNISLKELMD